MENKKENRQGKKISKSFWYKKFIEAIQDSAGNIVAACRTLGVTPQTYYRYRYVDPSFAEEVDLIIDTICVPLLEDIARNKAIHGNDKLLMFILRNRAGKKWNMDRYYEAQLKLVQEEKDNKIKEEQSLPTRAEIIGAQAYLDALETEEDLEPDVDE